MDKQELEEVVGTAIGGELPVLLAANGVQLTPGAIREMGRCLTARVMKSTTGRGIEECLNDAAS